MATLAWPCLRFLSRKRRAHASASMARQPTERKQGYRMARFRLRIIPTALFGLVGLLAFLFGAGCFLLFAVSSFRSAGDLAARYARELPGLAIFAVSGGVMFWSAFLWWRGRSRMAIFTAIRRRNRGDRRRFIGRPSHPGTRGAGAAGSDGGVCRRCPLTPALSRRERGTGQRPAHTSIRTQ